MGAVTDMLFLLVLIITTICEATGSDLTDVRCENVTGVVNTSLNLNCSVIQCPNSICGIEKYKFIYNDTDICNISVGRNHSVGTNFTCSYTPKAAVTGNFTFWMQSTTGTNKKNFSVSITDKIDGPTSSPIIGGFEPKITIIIAAVSIFIIIIIIIIMVVIHKRTCNCNNHSGLQMDYQGVSMS